MQVFSNGKLLRTMPITTGQQPAYTTRSGTKVIIEKFRYQGHELRDRSASPGARTRYNIKDVAVGDAGDLLR